MYQTVTKNLQGTKLLRYESVFIIIIIIIIIINKK